MLGVEVVGWPLKFTSPYPRSSTKSMITFGLSVASRRASAAERMVMKWIRERSMVVVGERLAPQPTTHRDRE